MKFHVPGVDLPDNIYKRIEKSDDPLKEGFEISLELIKKIKNISGVHGIHITALFWEKIIPELIINSKLIKDIRYKNK
jgi:methylenetetrahydrofolate reductase (NADPH)